MRVADEGSCESAGRPNAFRATEVADANKVPILRAYLKRWKAEVGVFFDGVSAASSDDDLLRIAPDHPVFQVHDQSSEVDRASPRGHSPVVPSSSSRVASACPA